MHLKKHFKYAGLSLAVALSMLALCGIANIAHSNCRGTAARINSADAMPRVACAIPHAGRGEHPKPWLRIVVTRAISIANYITAA